VADFKEGVILSFDIVAWWTVNKTENSFDTVVAN
jgi:hypothetical protein